VLPDFSTLLIEDGKRSVFLDGDRGTEAIFVPATTIAKSLVVDYSIGQPAQEAEVAGPGIFFVEGKVSKKDILDSHSEELKKAQKLQHQWWVILVRLADDLWTNNHKYSQISDLERTACRSLGLKRDWLDDSPDTITKCPYCTTLISTFAIVCFACRLPIKIEEYKKVLEAVGMNPVQTLNK